MKVIGYSPFGTSPGGQHARWYPFDSLYEKGEDLSKVDSLKNIDAVVLWGGEDISPALYNEKPFSRYSGPDTPSPRDLFEWELIKEAVNKYIPIYGLCRGAQLLCAFAGGKLIQDVSGHNGGYHQMSTTRGQVFATNSFHHQMMFPFKTNHELLAWSTNHLSSKYLPHDSPESKDLSLKEYQEPECVYFPEIKGLAIQGHPEWLPKEAPLNEWFLGIVKEKFL